MWTCILTWSVRQSLRSKLMCCRLHSRDSASGFHKRYCNNSQWNKQITFHASTSHDGRRRKILCFYQNRRQWRKKIYIHTYISTTYFAHTYLLLFWKVCIWKFNVLYIIFWALINDRYRCVSIFCLCLMRLLKQIFSQILSKFQKIKLLFKCTSKYLILSV